MIQRIVVEWSTPVERLGSEKCKKQFFSHMMISTYFPNTRHPPNTHLVIKA